MIVLTLCFYNQSDRGICAGASDVISKFDFSLPIPLDRDDNDDVNNNNVDNNDSNNNQEEKIEEEVDDFGVPISKKKKIMETEPSLSLNKTIKIPHAGISSLAVRRDDKIIATGGWDKRVRIFSAKTTKPLAILRHHTKGVNSVAFSSLDNSNLLACGSSDSHISIWSLY